MLKSIDYSNTLTRKLVDHKYQQYCGIEVIYQEPKYCKTQFKVTPDIDNLGHTLHGGVLYSMLDATSMLAVIPMLDSSEYALTSSFNASLMSTAPLDCWVEIEASVVKAGRNLIFSQSDAWRIENGRRAQQIASAQLCKLRLQRDVSR